MIICHQSDVSFFITLLFALYYMPEDLNITLRPSSGPFKTPKEIVQFYDHFDGWQEVLPKTDNTYSPGSKYYKYEVSPGIPFIPNMSRLPLKSYEKTPLKHDCSENQLDYLFTSSHIKKNLFITSTTYKQNKLIHHNEIQSEVEESFSTTQRKTSKIIKYVSQLVQILIKFIISHFIYVSTLTEIKESIMEIGSNIINTMIQKLTTLVHVASILINHSNLIITTNIQRIFHYYFGHNKRNRLTMFILFLVLLLLTACIVVYILPVLISKWQDSWTNFLISPFINILNLITAICQIIFSTMYFVLDLITVTFASSITAMKLSGQLFLNVFRNINTVVDSTNKINTVYVDQNLGFSSIDYNMLAKKVVASEEFQRILLNELNISQSNSVKLHDQEFQVLFKNQLQELNSENLKWMNNQLNEQRIKLQNIYSKMSSQEKETIQLMEKQISELQKIILNLTNNFESYKSEMLKSRTDSMSKDSCLKDDWHSIVNYIEQYVNMTMKSTLSIYDADKTGMVDYALESAGATVLGTRCTQTKPSTAALTMFGIPLWFISNGPRLAIQPGVNPGQCWAFIGAKGFLVLKLSKTIHITGVTIEHLPKSLSEDGHIRSAPKDFSIWGLKHETDSDGKLLGKYQFTVDGPSLQHFSIYGEENIFSIVELRIESNHGHDEYTCLYRIRVHGDLA